MMISTTLVEKAYPYYKKPNTRQSNEENNNNTGKAYLPEMCLETVASTTTRTITTTTTKLCVSRQGCIWS